MLGIAQHPSEESVLNDPATSDWLKSAILSTKDRNPVDAYQDAYRLLLITARRCQLPKAPKERGG